MLLGEETSAGTERMLHVEPTRARVCAQSATALRFTNPHSDAQGNRFLGVSLLA